jgi:putative transposase
MQRRSTEMKPNRFSIDQIIKIIAEADLPGSSVSSVARKYGINPNTIYRWRQKYKGMSASEAKRLKALEEENSRLKRLLAEKELSMNPRKSLIFWGPQIQALTDIIKKNI